MKKRIISILLAVCLVFGLLPVGVLAASAASGSCGKNATWSYNAATKTLSISGSGDMTDYHYDPVMGEYNRPPWDTYREEIEHVIINEGITSIGQQAFGSTWVNGNYPNLCSVSIAPTVTKIGAEAFAWAQKLESIELPNVTSIGYAAFNGTGIRSIYIPPTMEEGEGDVDSGLGWFINCTNLQTITVDPGNQTYRSEDGVLFSGDILLRYPAGKTGSSYTIPNGTARIALSAFEGNENITSVSVPASVSRIDAFAFNGCTKLQNITIAEGVTLVCSNAFCGTALTSIVLPASVRAFTSDWTRESSLDMLNRTFYFTGTRAPEFDTYCCNVGNGYKTTIYYPENATGWDAVQQQDNVKYQVEAGVLEFKVIASAAEDDENWVWGQDNYRFSNDYSAFGYGSRYISNSDLSRYLSRLSNTEIENIASVYAYGDSIQQQVSNLKANNLVEWSGSCYGMSLTAALFKAGILTPKSFGTSTTYGIRMNNDVKSFINVYHISTANATVEYLNCASIGNSRMKYVLKNMWNAANDAGQTNKPIIVYLASDTAAHAVVCYGAETGSYEFSVRNAAGVSSRQTFTKRLLIADPNLTRESYIYINDTDSYAVYSGETSYDMFGYYSAPLSVLDQWTNKGSFSAKMARFSIASGDAVRVAANGGTAIVQNGHILDSDGLDITVVLRNVDGENGVSSGDYSYILDTDSDTVTLSTVDSENLNASVIIGEYSVSVDGALASFTAGKDGSVRIENAEDNVQLDLAINDADFDFVSISGKADGDTTLSVTSDAVTVSGEIADMEFTNMNRQIETSTAVVHGDLDAKFTLKNDTVVATVDKDHDGTFETTLDSDTAQHQFKYVINTDGTHTARCTLCDKAITETHVFVNGVCVCGARKTGGSIDDGSHGNTLPITNDRISFTDVSKTDYFYDAVLWAVENGITTGTSRTRFSPYATCTRAQAVTFLWRASGSPAPKNSRMPFTDVSPSAYYYDAVLWALEEGITTGTSSTTFSPDAVIDRAQAVTFLHRANGAPSVTGYSAFTDVPQTAYYADAVKWAVDNGITTGTSAAAFSPNASCTRAQIVTFLYRAR